MLRLRRLMRWTYLAGFMALVLALAAPSLSQGQLSGGRAPVPPFLGLVNQLEQPSIQQTQLMLLSGGMGGLGMKGSRAIWQRSVQWYFRGLAYPFAP
jgi:hypothetical protein